MGQLRGIATDESRGAARLPNCASCTSDRTVGIISLSTFLDGSPYMLSGGLLELKSNMPNCIKHASFEHL